MDLVLRGFTGCCFFWGCGDISLGRLHWILHTIYCNSLKIKLIHTRSWKPNHVLFFLSTLLLERGFKWWNKDDLLLLFLLLYTQFRDRDFHLLKHYNTLMTLLCVAPPWCSSVHCDYSGHSFSPDLSFSLSVSSSILSCVFPTFQAWTKPHLLFTGWILLHSSVRFAWGHCRYFCLCYSIRTGQSLKEQRITVGETVTNSLTPIVFYWNNGCKRTTLTFTYNQFNRSGMKSFWFAGALKTRDTSKGEWFCYKKV